MGRLMMLGITQLGSGVFALMLAAFFYFFIDNLSLRGCFRQPYVMADCGNNEINNKKETPFLSFKRNPYCRGTGKRSFFSKWTYQSGLFLATLLLQHFNAVFAGGIIIYIIALLVGITRIYIGVHYPRDVIGGSVLGTAWGIVWAIINSYIR